MRALKSALVVTGLVPLGLLGIAALKSTLTANPIEQVTHVTGDWALRFLLITLAVTPLRRITGWQDIIRLRRMLGLMAFFYATLHLLTYVVLDYFFRFDLMWENLYKAKYITAGAAAFLLMLPLASTSSRRMMARLGRRWQTLHRLVYLAAIAGVVHYMWLIKISVRVPIVYVGVLVLLLAFRVWDRYYRRRTAPVALRAAPAK